jgi:hypothetical protein
MHWCRRLTWRDPDVGSSVRAIVYVIRGDTGFLGSIFGFARNAGAGLRGGVDGQRDSSPLMFSGEFAALAGSKTWVTLREWASCRSRGLT